MKISEKEQKRNWIYGAVFLTLALLLMALNFWLRWFAVPETSALVSREKKSLEDLQVQQKEFLNEEMRDLFAKYSEGVDMVDVIFQARRDVFSGAVDDPNNEAVMILDYVQFLEHLRKLLGKKSVLSNLTVSQSGRVSFLIQATAYLQVAKQMAALKFGFDQEPLLFKNFIVSSVGKNEMTGSEDELPQILRNSDASYDFIVQMEVNSKYWERNPNPAEDPEVSRAGGAGDSKE